MILFLLFKTAVTLKTHLYRDKQHNRHIQQSNDHEGYYPGVNPTLTRVLISIRSSSRGWGGSLIALILQVFICIINDSLMLRQEELTFYKKVLWRKWNISSTSAAQLKDSTLLSSFPYRRWLSSNGQGPGCGVSALLFFSSDFFTPLLFFGLMETGVGEWSRYSIKPQEWEHASARWSRSVCIMCGFMPRGESVHCLTMRNITSFCARGWWCCWQLDCPRATGWTQSTQSGNAQCPAAASDKWVQTPRWHSPRGPPGTAPPLPLRGAKHLETINKMVS